MMDQSSFFTGILGLSTPNHSTPTASPDLGPWLPPFIQILNTLLHNSEDDISGNTKSFLTNVCVLHEVAFSPKCPILGTGHNFAVFASPFDPDHRGFVPIDGRAVNPEIYCLKSPNFTSSGAADSPSSKSAFQNEYYHTILQELRILLHPQIRRAENIISLFGLDFQEDYDDYTIAWPVLLMEYAEHGTLATLQEDITIDMELARVLLLDVARGIQVLHECNIIHGDVKSENILICRHHQRKYIARLADFGLSVINPDPEKCDHRLPGGTFLWSAPELGSALSVEGLRQTDVYSFGLTAWRVVVKHPNPFTLIPPAALGLPTSSTLNESVTRAKSHEAFGQLVLQTLQHYGSCLFSRQVIEASLGKDPATRDLGKVILMLSASRVTQSLGHPSDASETYWAAEEPMLILEQLDDLCGKKLPSFAMKPSVLHSLVTSFEPVFTGTSALASQAGWFLFHFASDPQYQLLNKNADECCRILVRLCNLEHLTAQAIVHRYHELYGKTNQLLDTQWLETASLGSSYYALKSLRVRYPEEYQRLAHSKVINEPDVAEFENETTLLKCCRQGDFEGAKSLLKTGVGAFPIEEDKMSPLHWLVSFQDENQINELLKLLLENGAIIDAWEGEEHDPTYGRVAGTPLHWAVWHRNIPVLHALIKANDQPKLEYLNRAIYVAAGMHFYDVLKILKTWILSLNSDLQAGCDWHTALICAAENNVYQLARRLRHGTRNLAKALEQTMDIILGVHKPLEEDIKPLYQLAVGENNALILRYLFSHLGLGKRKDILDDPNFDIVLISLGMSFREIFEVCIENGLVSSSSKHGNQEFKPLQVCCTVRQRNPAFAKRLLSIGCPVDDRSKVPNADWTPFAIAVSLGMYHIAILLLEHGADKDYLLGWLGGSTVTMNLLQSWPDIPVSRLKFLLEEVPRLGFGHVAFTSWPGAGGNLLYALSMNYWSSYTAGYRLGETAKYILSQLADKSCLNKIDRVGATALRMACANGNLEICRALLEAGQDVNLALGFSPLGNAKDWLKKCQTREKAALADRNGVGSEKRLARTLRIRAQQTIELMVKHGAVDRGFFESMQNTREYVSSGQWQMPGFETALEMFSAVLDRSSMVETGSTPLNPTSSNQFRQHHGIKTSAQSMLGGLGRKWDQANGETRQPPKPRYQPHNCLPWHNDSCTGLSKAEPHQFEVAVVSRPLSVSQHSQISGSWSATCVDRGLLPPSTPISATNIPPPGNGASASLSHANTPRDSSDLRKLIPTTVEAIRRRLRDSLMLYFLEGGGDIATEKERRDQAICILKEQFGTPIMVSKPALDINECEEFAKVGEVVERCLEMMGIAGLSLIPELSDDGRELIVHVFG